MQLDGEAFVISVANKCVIHHKHFGNEVKDIKYSPDGSKFLMTRKNGVSFSLSVKFFFTVMYICNVSNMFLKYVCTIIQFVLTV